MEPVAVLCSAVDDLHYLFNNVFDPINYTMKTTYKVISGQVCRLPCITDGIKDIIKQKM